MADVDIRELRDVATRRARQQLDHIDFSGLAEHLPKNVNLDWNFIREREERAASRGFLGGFLLGGLLGVVLTLIFAPRRGVETRDLVASTAGDIKDKAVGLVGGSGEPASTPETSEVPETLADAKNKFEDIVADVSEKVSAKVEDATDEIAEVGENLDETDVEDKVETAKKSVRGTADKTKNKLDA